MGLVHLFSHGFAFILYVRLLQAPRVHAEHEFLTEVLLIPICVPHTLTQSDHCVLTTMESSRLANIVICEASDHRSSPRDMEKENTNRMA